MLLFALFAATLLSGQANKIFTKSVALQSSDRAYLDLPGPIQLESWKEDYLRITVQVKARHISENILQRLFIVGRYNIEVTENKSAAFLGIRMPKALHPVTVKGAEMHESYSFLVQYPESYNLILNKPNTNRTLGQRSL